MSGLLNISAPQSKRSQNTRRGGKPPFEGMVWIPGGAFLMGSNDQYPEEAPAHPVTVDGFWMDQHTVTNARFSRFVEETGYVTSAERAPDPGAYPGAKPELLVPASVMFSKPPFKVALTDPYNWGCKRAWRRCEDAT